MNGLFEFGNRYAKNSDWTDFALTKLCLCSLGVIIGTGIPKRLAGPARAAAGTLFLAAYAPLMYRVVKTAFPEDSAPQETPEESSAEV